jgi:hypothetical protein
MMPIVKRPLNAVELAGVAEFRSTCTNPHMLLLNDWQLHQLLWANNRLAARKEKLLDLAHMTVSNGRRSLEEYRTWSADQCIEFLQANGVSW